MNKYLNEIQTVAMAYAEILSKVLKTNVTIVDEKLRRIAVQSSMKSYYKEAVEMKDISSAGGITAYTILHKTITIVDTPREHEACRNCAEKEHCIEKYHMSAPILVRGEAKGALSFAATNNQQKKRMEKGRQMYLDLLVQFADLIALKMEETNEKRANLLNLELLQEIVEHSNEGILVFDNEGLLVQMNTAGSNLLEIREPLPVRAELIPLSEKENDSIYVFRRKHQTYKLSGKRYPLSVERYSEIFIFSNGVRTAEFQEKKKIWQEGTQRLIGESPAAEQVKAQIRELSYGFSPLLIRGDMGTEKREAALAVHEESSRREHEAYTINCKIYTAEALDTELMGIASANSRKGKTGRIERLKGGTLILEEIDSMPLLAQAKIIRLLDEEVIIRRGGQKPIPVDVRVIATTAKDLSELVRQGRFMEELYYKLIASSIIIPPLAERKEDISIYAAYYLEKYAQKHGKTIRRIEESFFSEIMQYHWPGNIWELKGAMKYVVVAMGLDGIVDTRTIPDYLFHTGIKPEENTFNLKELEKNAIKKALKEIGCDSKSRQAVADALGIGIATLYRKMKQYDLL